MSFYYAASAEDRFSAEEVLGEPEKIVTQPVDAERPHEFQEFSGPGSGGWCEKCWHGGKFLGRDAAVHQVVIGVEDCACHEGASCTLQECGIGMYHHAGCQPAPAEVHQEEAWYTCRNCGFLRAASTVANPSTFMCRKCFSTNGIPPEVHQTPEPQFAICDKCDRRKMYKGVCGFCDPDPDSVAPDQHAPREEGNQ